MVQHRPALGLRHRRPGQGHYYVDHDTGELTASTSAYEHPQPHACFIQSVEDDLVNEGGIMDLWVREARLFKYGSGTGTNFSKLRGENEKLSGGGKSSGLMSFLKIGDRAAGAIKSGGTTRRAAKMVVVDIDHPDIEAYINWKVKEEQKVAALVTGSKICQQRPEGHHEGLRQLRGRGRRLLRSRRRTRRSSAPSRRRAATSCPTTTSAASSSSRGRATRTSSSPTYDTDWDSEAYLTVSGQNSNNSVRVTDEFLQRGRGRRATGRSRRALDGKHRQDAQGARPVGEDRPRRLGLRRSRHPVPHHHQRLAHLPEAGPIRASNPCSEYMFLDDTACNLASLNLMMFRDARQALRRRRLRPRLPAVDDRARDLGADGAVPVQGDRRAVATATAPSASATPTSAAADGVGHPLRQRRGPRHLRRASRRS